MNPKVTLEICKTLCEKIGYDPYYVYAVIETESNRRTDVVSDAGAIGMMQLKEIAVLDVNQRYNTLFTKEDLFNPLLNIEIGILFLKRWEEVFRKMKFDEGAVKFFTLLTYAWGYGNVMNWLKVKPCNIEIKRNIPQDKLTYVYNVMYWYNHSKNVGYVEAP